jgi:antitoxin ParD1/3/4
MRTNIDIDDNLMAAALAGGELKTKREIVEEGLRLVARRHHYREVSKWKGKLHWNDRKPLQSGPRVGG